MEKRQPLPREHEAFRDDPLRDVPTEVILEQTIEEVTEHEKVLLERAERLIEVAKKAAKSDKLDQDARKPHVGIVGAPITLAATASTALGLVGYEVLPSHVTLPVQVATGALLLMNRSQTENRVVGLAEGNAIQCVRINQHSETVKDGKVLLAVHPRGLGNRDDARARARDNMADTLDVIALANAGATDENLFGGVVIAASVARQAGLSVTGGRSYHDVVQEITEEPANVPYKEAAVMLPMDSIAELANRLRQNPDAVLSRVLDDLAQRHPGIKDRLASDNPAILSSLHGLLQRIGHSEGRHVYWDKEIGRKIAEDLILMMDKSQPHNPRFIYRSAQTGEERRNYDLRSATGGQVDSEVLLRQLDEGRVDDLKLIRIALQLLEEVGGEPGEGESIAQKGASQVTMSDSSQDPELITLGEGVDKWKHRRRQLMRIALGSAALTGVIQTAALGISLLPIDTPSGARAQQVYRVENHGLEQRSPYWARETNYTFDGQWHPETQSADKLSLPRRVDANTPHLTIRTTLNDTDISLPIEEHTRLAALRAYTDRQKPVDVTVYRTEDGVVIVDGNKATAGAFLEYDLVAGEGPSVRANKPVEVRGPMYYSSGWKETVANAAEGSQFVSDNFIYDDNVSAKEALAHTHSPLEYVDHLQDTHRCQCEQCNTYVALMESRVRPEQKLTLVKGFLHARRKEQTHSYLVEGHAWLNDGTTIDATAKNTDKDSVLPQYPTVEALDAQWDENVQERLEEGERRNKTAKTALWSLMGLAGVGLAVLEARTQAVRRATRAYVNFDRRVTAALDIHPDDALQLMGWQAYSTWEGRVPEVGKHSNREGAPKETSIPTHTLEEVARGGFMASGQLTKEQQRGLRRTAKAMLSARRRSENQSRA